jgi:hypothetical protein
MKNTVERLTNRLDQSKKRMSGIEDNVKEILQTTIKKKNKQT